MSLPELIAGVEAHRATLTVYHAPEAARAELAERFADRNVEVVHSGVTDEGEEGFALLRRDGEVVTATPLVDLLGDPTTTAPNFDRRSYRAVLDGLDETLFTSFSTARMVAASREIEDRAWRRGEGRLSAGFQTLDVFADQTDVYGTLGGEKALDVHAYAAPEGEVPDCEGVTIHVERAPEIRDSWFVAYDGDGRDADKCLLLAEEREPGRFYGFWSYDPATVDYVFKHLAETYGRVDADGEPDAVA